MSPHTAAPATVASPAVLAAPEPRRLPSGPNTPRAIHPALLCTLHASTHLLRSTNGPRSLASLRSDRGRSGRVRTERQR